MECCRKQRILINVLELYACAQHDGCTWAEIAKADHFYRLFCSGRLGFKPLLPMMLLELLIQEVVHASAPLYTIFLSAV